MHVFLQPHSVARADVWRGILIANDYNFFAACLRTPGSKDGFEGVLLGHGFGMLTSMLFISSTTVAEQQKVSSWEAPAAAQDFSPSPTKA
jgi:hypothetical protein